MSDTPEKIYVGRWDTSWHDNRDLTCDIEYIRADLVDGMKAGNDELTKTIAFRIKDLQENKMLREALKKASDIFLAMDCDCCSLPDDEKCLRCYGMDSMTAALEAGKVDG